jgi:uncharacterized membrane protein
MEQRFARIIPMNVPPVSPANVGVIAYAAPATRAEASLRDATGIVLTWIGTLLYLGATATAFSGTQLVFAWLLWVVPIVLLAGIARPLEYFSHAAIVLMGVSVWWFLVEGAGPLVERWDRPTRAILPLLNLVALDGLFLCCLLQGMRMQLRRHPWLEQKIGAGTLLAWMILIGFAAINLEALRTVDWLYMGGVSMRDPGIVKQVVMSVLWAITGFATVIIGFRGKVVALRYLGLALLGITLAKILLVDMAEVKAVWRILSFVVVGGLLLAVSYVYHRHLETKESSIA